jgi:hypothetical protein
MGLSIALIATGATTAGRGPALPWSRIVLLALLLASGLIGGLEAHWRLEGHRPNVPDSKELWYFWRQRIYSTDGKVIVLLGTSRIQSDISLETMRERFPDYRVVQLGISGAHSCIGLLQDLAEDSAFKGIVVCELDTPLLDRSLWQNQADYRHYRPKSRAEYIGAVTKAFIADKCVLLRSAFSIKAIVRRHFGVPRAPVRDVVCTSFRRSAQWRLTDPDEAEQLRRSTTERYRETYEYDHIPTWPLLGGEIQDVNSVVLALRARGGDVVFLRAPSSRERWELEERYHPKAHNWDQFAATSAALCIHFKDLSSISHVRCPDDSHLNASEAVTFTRVLLDEFTRHQLLRHTVLR